jgi:6-phosphogluconate dehydrogenase
MMLVKAGSAVQDMIDQLVPLLEPGDIIIDGGNSEYHDSNVSVFWLKTLSFR